MIGNEVKWGRLYSTGSGERLILFIKKRVDSWHSGRGPVRKPNTQNDATKGSLIHNGPGVHRPSGENTQPNNSSIYYTYVV